MTQNTKIPGIKAVFLLFAVVFALGISLFPPSAIYFARFQSRKTLRSQRRSRKNPGKDAGQLCLSFTEVSTLTFIHSPKGHFEFVWEGYLYDLYDYSLDFSSQTIALTCKKDRLETIALDLNRSFLSIDRGTNRTVAASGFFNFYHNPALAYFSPFDFQPDELLKCGNKKLPSAPWIEILSPPPQLAA